MKGEWIDKIFETTASDFESKALALFRFQFDHNLLYRSFAEKVGRTPDRVQALTEIPFLPISFFKTHPVHTGDFIPEITFSSSGTSQTGNSRHDVRSLELYRKSFKKAFAHFYGAIEDYCILGLLPSYLERQGSSLVLMVDELIKDSHHPLSGTYLYEHDRLAALLKDLEAQQQKTLLIGVTFGLLDFAEKHQIPLKHTIVMETGGMKGRREEWTRAQVHAFLKEAFTLQEIHSEYGMTELLSQAYSKGSGIFECPPWMRVLLREEDDPLQMMQDAGSRGVINVIDLANVYSSAFIATDDAGKLYADHQFEVLGRVDHSDIRGCSLMAV